MALPMEPRGLVAEWDVARAGSPSWRREGAVLQPPYAGGATRPCRKTQVDLVENDVGGGFGARGEFYPEDFLIPFAARLTGRPVKWTEDRRENLMAEPCARSRMRHSRSPASATAPSWGCAVTPSRCRRLYAHQRRGRRAQRGAVHVGPYRIENIDLDVALQFTNKTPVGTYRGPGRFETDFFRERLFDIVAADLGIDRVEFRRRNLVPHADMPYSIATITPFESKDRIRQRRLSAPRLTAA